MKGKKPIDNLISLDSFDEDNGGREYDTVLEEIAQLKRTIAATPVSGDFAVAEERTDNQSALSGGEVTKLVSLVEELLRTTKQANTKTSEELADLRSKINKLDSVASVPAPVTTIRENGSASTAVLRQLYSIKEMLGDSSASNERFNNELNRIYDALDRVHYNMNADGVSMREKLESIDKLAKMLRETEVYDVVPVVEAVNSYLSEIERMPLDKDKTESVIEFADSVEGLHISNSRKELIRAYMSTVSAKIREGGVDCIDALPDVIALKNNIQHNKYEYENELKYSDILNKNIMLLSERDIVKNKNLRAEIKEKINALVSLEVKDLFVYPPIRIKKAYPFDKEITEVSLSQKIDELKAYVADAVLPKIEESEGGSAIVSGLAAEINALKKELTAISDTDGIKRGIEEISEKLDGLTIGSNSNEVASAESSKEYGVTLGEIVIQLDRLFDDIRTIYSDGKREIYDRLDGADTRFTEFKEDNALRLNETVQAVNDVRALLENGGLEQRYDELAKGMESVNAKLDELQDVSTETKSVIVDGQAAELTVIATAVKELTGVVADLKSQIEEAVLSQAKIISEIDKLREQTFAVNMLTVEEEDGSRYESYNNVIFDELCVLREDFDSLKSDISGQSAASADELSKVAESILEDTAVIKAKLSISEEEKDASVDVNNAAESKEQLSKSLSELKNELEKLAEDIAK